LNAYARVGREAGKEGGSPAGRQDERRGRGTFRN